MPGLSVTEPDLHTGSLLGIFITCAKNCHTRIEFQGSPEGKIIIVGLGIIQNRQILQIQSRVILNAERNFQQLPVRCPGFQTQLCRTSLILGIQNLNFNQFIIQPNSCIIALTHNTQPDTVFAGITPNLPGT